MTTVDEVISDTGSIAFVSEQRKIELVYELVGTIKSLNGWIVTAKQTIAEYQSIADTFLPSVGGESRVVILRRGIESLQDQAKLGHIAVDGEAERFIASMVWSDDATDEMKTLVLSNIRGFAAALKCDA
jgi:hypothetical protein